MENLMNSEEVAEILKVRSRTVYVWAFQNRIPHCKVNGALRFRPSEIEAFVGSGCALPTQTAGNLRRKAKVKQSGLKLNPALRHIVEQAKTEAGNPTNG